MNLVASPDIAALRAYLNKLVDFCAANRGQHCFKRMGREQLFRYVAFCYFTGRLLVLLEDDAPTAIAFCWPENFERLEAAAEKNVAVFRWELKQPKGDCLFVAEVIGTRARVARLYRVATNVSPQLLITAICTFRRGKLVRLRQFTIERFAR